MFSISEIKSLTKAVVLQGTLKGRFKRITINSKEVCPGDLFIAIKGGRFDGHRFISEAIKKGAVACLVSSKGVKAPKRAVLFYVPDTEKALGFIARGYRQRFDIPVIAITGSAGKTTTKDMVASVLSARYSVLSNLGSQNNQIGVPLTLLKLTKKIDVAVIEMGTNQPGDIKWLTSIALPDMSILTNIGASHLAKLKSKPAVFREKLNLVKGLAAKGTVIFNRDDPFLVKIPLLVKGRSFISYGVKSRAKFQARHIILQANRSLQFSVDNKKYVLSSPVQANVYNALSAIICGRLFSISFNNIYKKIKKASIPKGRQQIKKVGRIWLIDDTYNANPVSFRSALNTLSDFKACGRRILVCSDMKELGASSHLWHKTIGRDIGKSNIDYVLAWGKAAKHIVSAARPKKDKGQVYHFEKRFELHKKVRSLCRDHDVILVKGSHSMQMGKTVDFILKHFKK
ncbi:MAG: UDP-N-acetylmuramoyl-tripeptide--D-alanyl-D-alanine ligase [Candidatus Omnitrophica bacterium]|nr:UDP-N-acetylmuramoyl-tripeptide--D-alanyl-D-alanine ligase [Candidatus Omnitrophota bacterium]